MPEYPDIGFEAAAQGRLPQLVVRINALTKLATSTSIWKTLNGT